MSSSDSSGKSNAGHIQWRLLFVMKGVVFCSSMRLFALLPSRSSPCHRHLKLNQTLLFYTTLDILPHSAVCHRLCKTAPAGVRFDVAPSDQSRRECGPLPV